MFLTLKKNGWLAFIQWTTTESWGFISTLIPEKFLICGGQCVSLTLVGLLFNNLKIITEKGLGQIQHLVKTK